MMLYDKIGGDAFAAMFFPAFGEYDDDEDGSNVSTLHRYCKVSLIFCYYYHVRRYHQFLLSNPLIYFILCIFNGCRLQKQAVIHDFMSLFDEYEQVPFLVNFWRLAEDGNRVIVGQFWTTLGFCNCVGDLKECNFLCGCYMSTNTPYPCRMCLVKNTEMWKPYDVTELRNLDNLNAMWEQKGAAAPEGEVMSNREVAELYGYLGYHINDGPPGLSGLAATLRPECVEVFKNRPDLLRLSYLVDTLCFDIIHTFGNGICKRVINNVMELMKLLSAGAFKRLHIEINRRMQSVEFLWGVSPSSGTPIRAVYKDLVGFKNLRCKEYQYAVQKLLVALGHGDECEFFPAAAALAVRKLLMSLSNALLIISRDNFEDEAALEEFKTCVMELGELHETAFRDVDTSLYFKIHNISHLVSQHI